MGLRVLIVDDNPVARGMLCEMMLSSGHQVVGEAVDLNGTMKALKASEPELITLDISLSVDDGLSVLKAIRAVDSKVKVLIVSGNAQKKLREDLRAAGASGFLDKPFVLKDLTSALAEVGI